MSDGEHTVYSRGYEGPFEKGFNVERKSGLSFLKNWAWLQEQKGYESIVAIVEAATADGVLPSALATVGVGIVVGRALAAIGVMLVEELLI